MAPPHDQVTHLLREWSRGNQAALRELAPLVYHELHRIAGSLLKNERPGQTLQTTALVHEAYIRLVQQDQPEWNSRAHFTAVASQYMRQVLVDHTRRRNALERGGGVENTALNEAVIYSPERPAALLALDDALDELALAAPDDARMVEMRFFGGMTQEEIAEVRNIHVNTVSRRLRLAQA